MPGLDRRLPEEQISKGSICRMWKLWRSSCQIQSATGQCIGTSPLLRFHQRHARACELQMLAIHRWQHHIYREVKANIDCYQLQQDLDPWMGKILWVVFWPLKVSHNACHIVTRKRKLISRDYTINSQTLSTVDTATHLVVELSSDLT